MSIIGVFMCLSFAIGIQTASDSVVGQTQALGTRMAGDINGDNLVDVLDARMILEIVNGNRVMTASELAGDPNQDSQLTIDDAIELLRRIDTR